ncbi:MAG: ubiquitin-conjugating enzyme family protein [Nitrososphaerota archaeon]|nr:ubiquitin-conjugating enzyme family protein [Nitrososphaerota archaeon]
MYSEEVGLLPEHLWYRRLAQEYQLVRNYEPTFDTVRGDLTHYRGVIVGTGLYEGGMFLVEVFLDRTFPYTPPKVLWLTRIWHPNFTDEVPARICESILTKDWYPNIHLVAVIEALKNLLSNPNPDDPLNAWAAYEMKNSFHTFVARVRQYIELYAAPEKVLRG